MRVLAAIAMMLLATAVGADAFNTSIYIKMTSTDNEVYEVKSRRMIPAALPQEDRSGNWGISFEIAPLGEQAYTLKLKVYRKLRTEYGLEWQEYASQSTDGTLGAPLDFEFESKDIQVESAFFVSPVP